jgi:hypothetical protein
LLEIGCQGFETGRKGLTGVSGLQMLGTIGAPAGASLEGEEDRKRFAVFACGFWMFE